VGYIRHHAIIITGTRWPKGFVVDALNTEIDDAHRAALEAGCEQVTPIVGPAVNYTFSFLVAPDGSKEFWDTSDEGDEARAKFIAWLRANNHFDWAEVVLGCEDDEAFVAQHAWDTEHAED